MKRKSGILAAGTLTGLVIIIILIFGIGGLNAAENNATALPPAANALTGKQSTVETANSDSLQAWQTYSRELETAVEMLQIRERQYQAELNAANETILQLQDKINAANSAPAAYGYEEYDDEDQDDDDHDDDHDDDDHDAHEDHEDDD